MPTAIFKILAQVHWRRVQRPAPARGVLTSRNLSGFPVLVFRDGVFVEGEYLPITWSLGLNDNVAGGEAVVVAPCDFTMDSLWLELSDSGGFDGTITLYVNGIATSLAVTTVGDGTEHVEGSIAIAKGDLLEWRGTTNSPNGMQGLIAMTYTQLDGL